MKLPDSIASAFPAFTKRFEGLTTWMYLDVKGLVTTGRGNLIDPVGLAVGLPWARNGAPADQSAIHAEWSKVKAMQAMANRGGGYFASVTSLRLSDQAVDDLTDTKAQQLYGQLQARFGLAAWPEPAQLATLSMAWAMGAGFSFPHWEAAVRAGDWATAADQCTISTAGNPGVVPRNAANRELFSSLA